MPQKPEKEPSDEVDRNQLQMARTEGEAYHSSATYMMTSVANTGDVTRVGDYYVGFAQEEAEGMWELRDEGEFEFVEPDEENCHVEIVVTDGADKRFVPHLDVTVTLEGEGETVGPVETPFLWHPGVHHYGANVELPGDGTYDLHVEIAPPTFKRHDETNGNRYGETVETTFEGVEIETGQD
ncbi:iron transporter [Halopelagius fulvigenes]|uniref:Iron transporter n=1 Tax=Halopelagius fulvigenes TaxID=1198324 RepID=A0ABD5TXI7_9EURY